MLALGILKTAIALYIVSWQNVDEEHKKVLEFIRANWDGMKFVGEKDECTWKNQQNGKGYLSDKNQSSLRKEDFPLLVASVS